MRPDRQAGATRDPRAARSAAALRAAILDLAAEQPIGTVTVDQVVEAAGITRKTFYNHVRNPTELLMQTLTKELNVIRERMDQALRSSDTDLATLSRARLSEIIAHILHRRRVYQQADGRIHPYLYRLLSDHFYAAIRFSLNEPYRVLSRELSGPKDAVADIHASFVASAYAGAIDTWLPHANTIGTDALLDIIIASLPHWMTTRA